SYLVGYVFVQAEDVIRYDLVTGVQTCALPILARWRWTRLKKNAAYQHFLQLRHLLIRGVLLQPCPPPPRHLAALLAIPQLVRLLHRNSVVLGKGKDPGLTAISRDYIMQ